MKDSFFFRKRTLPVPTWKAVLLFALCLPVLCWASWPLIRGCVTAYLWKVDQSERASIVVLENWSGEVDLFENAAKVLNSLQAETLCSVIYEDWYANARKRHAYLLNAWASGIDTTRLKLIPVLKLDPKTLHTAEAVIDTARKHRWETITLLTIDLHTARSGKAYRKIAQPFGIVIRVAGLPYEGIDTSNWYRTSSGLALGFSEMVKRIYYDLFIF
jgi:hypothetical protein